MKKLLSFFCFAFGLLFLLLFPQKSFAQGYSDYITSFTSDISFNQDASISIKETINYHFASYSHGIYRDIPVSYKTQGAFSRPTRLILNDLYYFDNNNPSQKYMKYERATQDGYAEFKIGGPDTEINGDYTYVLDYKLIYAVNYFDDHDELYLNITGDEWNVPINSVSANIEVPGDIIDKICYTGVAGSTQSECTFNQVSNTRLLVSANSLDSYNGLTVALKLPKGSIADTTDQQKIEFVLANIGILLPIPTLIGIILFVKSRNKNKKLTIIPNFDTPKGWNPLRVGYLYKNNLNNNIITAQLIQLAIDGYIKIKQTSRSNYQILKTEKSYPADNEELMLYNSIFKTRDSVSIKDLSSNFYSSIFNIKNSVERHLYSDQYLSQKQKNVFVTLLTISIIGIFLLLIFIGFFTTNAATGWFLGLLLSFVILLISAFKIDKKTEKGNIIFYDLEGLKMYINTAEEKRIEFHNDPKRYSGIFERLLPYSIIFGLEKKWAKEFKDIYTTEPDWYEGNWDTFNTYLFVSSIGNFNRQMNNSVSGRSFSSSHAGFGGSGFSGGSSGGGFGGGGGGSW